MTGPQGAHAGSCRPGRGQAAMTWTANGAAAPAQLRFPPALRIDHTRADLRALWPTPGAA